MAAWREVFDFLVRCAEQSGHSFTDEVADSLFRQVTGAYENEVVRIVRPRDSRRADIQRLAKSLPTETVSARLGVTRSWVNRVIKK